MQKIKDRFGFYGILTNPIRGYEYLANLFVDYEIEFIQLRMKDESEAVVESMAEKIKKITMGSKSKFIVNDYPHIAVRVEADGVHVGQTDLPYDEVRNIVGEDMIIGLSTHSPKQTVDACNKNPDYIGVGPVFPTPTKKNADEPIGVEGMKTMLDLATVPAVILGSIDSGNLAQLLKEGAKNFSLVRPLNNSSNPEDVLKNILDIFKNNL